VIVLVNLIEKSFVGIYLLLQILFFYRKILF